jgi:hypothetical protein
LVSHLSQNRTIGLLGPLRRQSDPPDHRACPVPAVFVAGSRQVSRLPSEVRTRVDTMIEKGFQILVGDPNGVDKAAQEHLSYKSYPSVLALGALALFVEALENFVTLAAAVLFARAELWWQTEVPGLLLHADAL